MDEAVYRARSLWDIRDGIIIILIEFGSGCDIDWKVHVVR